MLKKPFKVITSPNLTGTLKIYGNNHLIPLDYQVPEWNKDKPEEDQDLESCFVYKGHTYFLSEFMRIEKNAPAWMQEYHGYMSDSYFSGIVVKLDFAGESVKVYTYIS